MTNIKAIIKKTLTEHWSCVAISNRILVELEGNQSSAFNFMIFRPIFSRRVHFLRQRIDTFAYFNSNFSDTSFHCFLHSSCCNHLHFMSKLNSAHEKEGKKIAHFSYAVSTIFPTTINHCHRVTSRSVQRTHMDPIYLGSICRIPFAKSLQLIREKYNEMKKKK